MSNQEDGRGLFSGTTIPRDRESYGGYEMRSKHDIPPPPWGPVKPTPTPSSERTGLEPETVTERPPLAITLSEVHESVSRLEGAVERMVTRLAPILRASSPVEAKPGYPVHGESTVVRELTIGRERIDELVDRVNSVRERLEV